MLFLLIMKIQIQTLIKCEDWIQYAILDFHEILEIQQVFIRANF